jgi:hypothetical protein
MLVAMSLSVPGQTETGADAEKLRKAAKERNWFPFPSKGKLEVTMSL